MSGVSLTTNNDINNSGTMTDVTAARTAIGTNNFNNGTFTFDSVTNISTPHPGVFNGGDIRVSGDFTNNAGSSFTGSGGANTVTNNGTMVVQDGSNFLIGADPATYSVRNGGDLTARGGAFNNGSVAIPISNSGTLRTWGIVTNDLSGDGDVRIADPNGTAFETRFEGMNLGLFGDIYVDSGKLHIYHDTDLGSPANLNQSITVAGGSVLQLDAMTVSSGRSIGLLDNGTLVAGTTGVYIPGVLYVGNSAQIYGKLTVDHMGSYGNNASINLVGGADFTVTSTSSLNGGLSGFGSFTVDGGADTGLYLGGSTLDGTITLLNGSFIGIGGPYFTSSLQTSSSVTPVSFYGGGTTLVGTVVTHDGDGNVTHFYSGGVISGPSPVEISNHTNVILNANETYTGLTTIASGSTLTLGDGGTTGSVAGDIANSGNLTINRADTFTLGGNGGSISGGGSITQAGSGTTIANDASFLNGLTITNGTFVAGNGSTNFGTGGFGYQVTNNSIFALNGTGAATIAVAGTGRVDNLGAANLDLTLNGASGLNHYGSGTISLGANPNFSGPVFVGAQNGTSYGNVAGGGTLVITGDASLGTAPATYTANQLVLNAATLRTSSSFSFAATRGVTIGSLGATFDVLGSLVMPTVLNGSSGTVTLTGGGSLTLVSGFSTLGYHVQQGTLILNNQDVNSFLFAPVTVDAYATLRLSGSGITSLTAAAGGLDGNVKIDAGTRVDFAGNTNAAPANQGTSFANGEITNNGTLRTFGSGQSIASLAGTGDYERDGSDTITFGSLQAHTVTLNTPGGLAAASYNADITNISSFGTALTVDTGHTRALTLLYDLTLNVSNGFYVDGTISPYNLTITKNGLGSLVFTDSGTINEKFILNKDQVDGNGDPAGGFLFSQGGNTFTGVISGAAGFLVSDPTLTKDTILTADNTFTGGTIVSSGRLVLGSGTGSTGSVVGNINFLTSLGTVAYNHGSVAFSNPAGDYTLSALNTITGLGTVEQAGSGTLTIDSWVSGIDPASDATAPTVPGSLRVTNGTQRLTDTAAGFGHAITVASPGTLSLAPAATKTLTVDSVITGTGAVAQTGAGTSVLTAANTFGSLAVSAGTLVLGDANAVTAATIASGATLSLADGLFAGNVQHYGSLTGAVTNNGTISLDRSGTYLTTFTATGSGSIEQNAAGDAYLVGNQVNQLVVNSGRLVVNEAANATVTSSGRITGAGTFAHLGSGTLILSGGTENLGSLLSDSGTLRLTGGHGFNSDITTTGGTVEIAQSMTYNPGYTISGVGGQLAVTNNSYLSLKGTINLTGATTIAPGSSLGLFDGSSITGPIVNNGLIAFNYLNDATFANAVSGTGAFDISNIHRIEFTGANTATGGATISNGSTLALSGNGSVGGTIVNNGTLEIVTTSGATRLIPGNISGSGTLNLSGTGTIEVAGDLSYTGATTLSDGVTLSVNNTGTSTFAHSISGTGNLDKGGSGTLVIATNTTLNGDVTISGGTLQIGTGGDTGYLFANHITDNGTLAYNLGTGNAITLGSVSGQGGIRQMGAGSLTITGDNPDLVGDTTVDAGRSMQIGNPDGSTGSVGGKLVANGTIFYDRTGDISLTHGLAGDTTGSLNLGYSGNLALSGPLNFAGTLALDGGALTVNSTLPSYYLGNIQGASAISASGSLTLVGNSTAALPVITNSGTLTIGTLVRSTVDDTLSLGLADATHTLVSAAGSFQGSVFNGRIDTINSGVVIFQLAGDYLVGSDSTRALNGTGLFTQAGSGTVTVGDHLFADDFSATSGILRFRGETPNLGTVQDPLYAGITSNGTGTIFLEAGTYGNQIGGSGALQTQDAVTLTNLSNSFNRSITIGAGSLTVNTSLPDLTLGGALLGAGDLHYTGTGSVVLADDQNTGTIYTDGRRVTSNGSLTSGVHFNNAPVAYQAADQVNHTPTIPAQPNLVEMTAYTGTAIFSGGLFQASELDLSGTGTAELDTDVTVLVNLLNGHLALGTGGDLHNLTFASLSGLAADFGAHNVTLTSLAGGVAGDPISGTGALTLQSGSFAGDLSGFASLTKTTAGSVTLSGTNTFTGGLTVTTGDLTLSGANTINGISVGFGNLTLSGSNSGTGGYVVDFGTLTLGSTASLGSNLVTLQDNGRLETTGATVLSALTLANGGYVGGNLTLGSVTGTGTLTIADGSVLLNGNSAYANNVVVNNLATLALGNTAAINPLQTTFNSGSTFDVYGHDWSAALSAENVTIANSAATAATVSSTVGVETHFGLAGTGGSLTFAGDINLLNGASAVDLGSDGQVVLGDTAAAKIGSLGVNSGNLQASAAALTGLTSATLQGTGRLTFTQGGTLNNLGVTFHSVESSSLNPGVEVDGSSLLNNSGAAVTVNGSLTLIGQDLLRRDSALIGGSSDLVFDGTIGGGELSLMKVGTGNLTLNATAGNDWSTANGGARVGVREGTLTTSIALLQNRGLVVENTGVLALTDPSYLDLQVRSLAGNGTLALGDRGLTVNQANDGTFTGSVTTTGFITHNAADGSTFASGSISTQTYGTLNVGGITVNVGNVVVTDAIHAGSINVQASGAGGSFTTTTNGLVTGNIFTGNLYSAGTTRLVGGSAISGNAGSISFAGAAGQVRDDYGPTDTVSHLTSNSGSVFVSNGASISGTTATFANTGSFDLSDSTWTVLGNVTNQGEMTMNGTTLSAVHYTQTGGSFTLSPHSTVIGSDPITFAPIYQTNPGQFIGSAGGSAANNPAFVATGGSVNANGSISGGLSLTNTKLAVGGAGTVGTVQVTGGVLLGASSGIAWDMSDATGASGTGYDLLQVTNTAAATDGKIIFTADTAHPVVFNLNGPNSGFSAPANFDAAHDGSWVVATTTDGFTNFSSDKFLVNTASSGLTFTGNFGLVTDGNNLDLVYNRANLIDVATGNGTTLADASGLASTGPFAGLRKTGAGTLTITADNLYPGPHQSRRRHACPRQQRRPGHGRARPQRRHAPDRRRRPHGRQHRGAQRRRHDRRHRRADLHRPALRLRHRQPHAHAGQHRRDHLRRDQPDERQLHLHERPDVQHRHRHQRHRQRSDQQHRRRPAQRHREDGRRHPHAQRREHLHRHNGPERRHPRDRQRQRPRSEHSLAWWCHAAR